MYLRFAGLLEETGLWAITIANTSSVIALSYSAATISGMKKFSALAFIFSLLTLAQAPHPVPGGFSLPNGWQITPVGHAIQTEDLILNLSPSPDGRVIVAQHGGFNPHGLVVIDTASEEAVQRIPLRSAWLGLAWSADGSRLFVSGGSASGSRHEKAVAPIYVFSYAAGRLSEKPIAEWTDVLPANKIYWSGLAMHPQKNLLYAANRGNDPGRGHVSIFDAQSGKVVGEIGVDISPYELRFNSDGSLLFVSNWGSDNISVIDTAKAKVVATIPTGRNPNDMELSPDGRLYVSNGNENSVTVIDTNKRQAIETINVGPTAKAPQGSTPNGLSLDRRNNMLFVANADNNAVAVVNVKEQGNSQVMGFIPTGWYPSALYLTPKLKLYIGNSKGLEPHATPMGPGNPDLKGPAQSIKVVQKGTVNVVSLSNLKGEIKEWTRKVYQNIPYKDDYLTMARAPKEPSIVPQEVGAGSPVKHVIYIIKENRTYDQVFGDIKKGNGDPRLTIFGEQITPNQHAIADQWVLLDNLYCDGEVSVDGHSWSNSAIATDYNEKMWPANYGGHSAATLSNAYVPASGHMWDAAAKKGLTYRSYGEYATRSSDGTTMDAAPGIGGLLNHVSPKFKLPNMRDTDNVHAFFDELDGYDRNFDSNDATKRLPNFVVMSLGEDHTAGTRPGSFSPRAMVANHDWAIGQLVERMSHSPYWPETAIFLIEDDAQDGPDHVDGRRTVGMVAGPFVKRGFVDSTLYTTSAMLRTMELLLGLPPMTQYDAAALPMYNSFRETADLTAFQTIAPKWDVNEKNTAKSPMAKASMRMDFTDYDRAPMAELNQVIWKSVKGSDSEMPAPVHRFWFQSR